MQPEQVCKQLMQFPTNNALLRTFGLSFYAEILLMSTDSALPIGTKYAKTCMQCVYIPTELPFCIPPLVVGLTTCNTTTLVHAGDNWSYVEEACCIFWERERSEVVLFCVCVCVCVCWGGGGDLANNLRDGFISTTLDLHPPFGLPIQTQPEKEKKPLSKNFL